MQKFAVSIVSSGEAQVVSIVSKAKYQETGRKREELCMRSEAGVMF